MLASQSHAIPSSFDANAPVKQKSNVAATDSRLALRETRPVILASWSKYITEAPQRSVLFLDLLRQRGDEEIEMTS